MIMDAEQEDQDPKWVRDMEAERDQLRATLQDLKTHVERLMRYAYTLEDVGYTTRAIMVPAPRSGEWLKRSDVMALLTPKKEPPKDVMDSLHAVFTRHGISSYIDHPQLAGDIVHWACEMYRQSSKKEPWTALDGSLTIRALQNIATARVARWHDLKAWSPLEWGGAMAGETGEACNGAKKLKRIDDGLLNINTEPGRSLTDRETAAAHIVAEIADAFIYGVIFASSVGMDLEEAIRMAFNKKSEEYGFPERIPPNQPPET